MGGRIRVAVGLGGTRKLASCGGATRKRGGERGDRWRCVERDAVDGRRRRRVRSLPLVDFPKPRTLPSQLGRASLWLASPGWVLSVK